MAPPLQSTNAMQANKSNFPLKTLAGCIALLILGLARPACADPRGRPLTLEQAVGLALAHSPQLRAAQHSVVAARARVEQARSAYWPRVGLDAAYLARWPKQELPMEFPPQFAGLVQLPEMDDIHHFRAGISAGWRAVDFSRGPRVEAGQAAVKAEQAGQQQAQVKLALATRKVYLAALFARDAAQLSAQALAVARQQEKRAADQLAAGTGTRLVQAQARARVAELEARDTAAVHQRGRLGRVLANLTGLGSPPRLTDELERVLPAPAAAKLERNPALTRLDQGARALELSARSASRTFWPTLTLVGKAEVEYPHVFRTEFGPVLQGGAMLSWQLFDGFHRGATARRSRAQARKLQQARLAARQGLERELIQLDARQQAALAQLAAARKTLAQAEVYLAVARQARGTGAATHLEVSQAQVGVDQARMGIRKALLERNLVRAELLAVNGSAGGSK